MRTATIVVTPVLSLFLAAGPIATAQERSRTKTGPIDRTAAARQQPPSDTGGTNRSSTASATVGRKAVGVSLETPSAPSDADLTGAASQEADRSAARQKRLSRRPHEVDPSATDPRVFLVVQESDIQSGGLVTVDAYASRVSQVRLYQVAVQATGGKSGQLELEDLWIDKDAGDYVFGSEAVVDAVDLLGARMGAVLFDGEVDIEQPAYLGTFIFRASDDAGGTFRVGIRADGRSFLSNASNEAIAFHPGPDAVVKVTSATKNNSNTSERSREE